MPLTWITIFLPSLIAIELLSFLVHCRFGVAGIVKKKDAWIEALNRRDELSDGNRSALKQMLIPFFQSEPVMTGKWPEAVVRKVISVLFRANWRFVK